jgi:hypothetical protein
VYTLDGRQKKALHAALLAAFPRQASLEQVVLFHLDTHLAVVAGEGPLTEVVFRLMDWAEAQGRLDALVNGARDENPHNPQLIAFERLVLEARDTRPQDSALRQFAERVQLAPVVPADPELEKRVFRAGFSDIAQWRARLGQAELAVCRIEAPAWRALGTGFLVGPDLIVTNRHVVESLASDAAPALVARFDFKVSPDGAQLREGRTFGLARDWLVASSPVADLDFAVLRLDARAGDLAAGGTPGAPPRGWITPAWRDLEPDETVFVIQHPQGDALKLAAGRFEAREPTRLRYRVDTEPGSSGSPCFTAQLELVALHRGAAEGTANQGVPFDAIVAALPAAVRASMQPFVVAASATGLTEAREPVAARAGVERLPDGPVPTAVKARARRRPIVAAAALLVVALTGAVAWWRPWTSAHPPPIESAVRQVPVSFAWERVANTRGSCESRGGVTRALYRGQSQGAWPATSGRQARDLLLVAYDEKVAIEDATASMAGNSEALSVLGGTTNRDLARKLQFPVDVTVPVVIVACVRTPQSAPDSPPFRVSTWKEVTP